MIVVDSLLKERERRGEPIRVGMIGSGFMGRGIANQIINSVPGMSLVGIANRNIDNAYAAYRYAGQDSVSRAGCVEDLERSIMTNTPSVTDDFRILCAAPSVEVLIEVTGTIEYGAQVLLAAFSGGKDVILVNAEIDGTLGPLLKRKAEAAGVLLSACDGDQPGVQMNLYRFVRGIGLTPLVCGNIKGLQDRKRNPTTQESFALRWGQNVNMVTSFADGTKISFEQTIVANATGMTIAQRGMRGLDFPGHVDDLVERYDVELLRSLGGVVDYVVGAKPAPGVFVFASHDDERQRHYLELYKLGRGPLYSFYAPYHLCHFEVPNSVARAVLLRDAVLQPAGGPVVEVVATAKIPLRAGTELDGIGGYHTYGQCEISQKARGHELLPMGLAQGCRLRRDVKADEVLRLDDVERPEGRLIDGLFAEQESTFAGGRIDTGRQLDVSSDVHDLS